MERENCEEERKLRAERRGALDRRRNWEDNNQEREM